MRVDELAMARVLVTGGGGLLGTALLRQLASAGVQHICAPRRNELDLLNADATAAFIEAYKPDVVIHLASLVYGLAGNMHNQMASLTQNTLINLNVLSAISKAQPQHLIVAGTVASYPFPYPAQPLNEKDFFLGLPHDGEFGYAMAKKHAYAFTKLLEAEVTGLTITYAILTNLYGENDRFDVKNGHVIPSLIAKAHQVAATGKALEVWGDGNTIRDFLHAEDAARALLLCLEKAYSGLINISSGEGITIGRIAELIGNYAGVSKLEFKKDQPVGITNRVVDNSRLRGLGFIPGIAIENGLERTYQWYARNIEEARI